MFAIHFTAFDKAGNHKTSRKVILYDDQSVITQKPNKVTRIVTASSETSYVWVVQDTGTIVVRWTDRFINVRHENNRWLNKVNSHIAVEDKYDDHYGERQITEINNVHGKGLCGFFRMISKLENIIFLPLKFMFQCSWTDYTISRLLIINQ